MISGMLNKFGLASIATSLSVKAAELKGVIQDHGSLSDYALIISLVGGLLLIANNLKERKIKHIRYKNELKQSEILDLTLANKRKDLDD